MTGQLVDRWCERAVLSMLEGVSVGELVVELPGSRRVYGRAGSGLAATLCVADGRFFRRAALGGEIGVGDSYMDGDWTSPDLVALVRLMLANRQAFPELPSAVTFAPRLLEALAHRRRSNTRHGSRRNIHAHYDLGNEFFRLFLDANLLYSCALFDEPADSLEAAQVNKLRAICDKLGLGPGDHVLEIGTGWGGFALFAATRYGCRVTTTTISEAQHAYASELFSRAGAAGRRIDLRLEDYRDLRGRYDAIVSIEMFEAVGLDHYDDYFAACERLLDAGGAMLLQTITVDDWRFREYRSAATWISKRIFPGAELASVAEILASLARVSRLNLHHVQPIGPHYARTLRCWRERFLRRLDDVRAQGFDDRFIRMWDLYLAYCEAAFDERHIGDVQLVLSRPGTRRRLVGDVPRAAPALSSPAVRVSAPA